VATGSNSSNNNSKANQDKADEKPKADSKSQTEENKSQSDEKKPPTFADLVKLSGETRPGTDVVEPGVHKDQQAGTETENDKDPFVNPNGVNFQGRNPINKTPADMSAETPEMSQQRYGISDEIPDDVIKNPNITEDGKSARQIASGTHLHPDVARDTYNRSLERTGGSENAAVTTSGYKLAFATEAPVDDKGIKNDPPRDLA
jgi:hypothetical protein